MKRIDQLVAAMQESQLDALLITNEINVRYLTGFTGDSTYLLISEAKPLLLSDGRYESQISSQCPDFEALIRSPSDLLPDLTREAFGAVRRNHAGPVRLGLEAEHLSMAAFQRLTDGCDSVEFVEVVGVVERLRMIKDAAEIQHTRDAVDAAQRAFRDVVPKIKPEWTELQVSYELESVMRSFGAEGCSFSPIVAAGAGAALPHYQPGDRSIGGESTLLIDWGAKYMGYASDLTRTLHRPGNACGASDRFKKAYETVLEAQMAAIEAIGPGVSTRIVDDAARAVLRKAGLEDAFKHGLGHGIGLQIHEGPRMSAIGDDPLQSGMIITVEPGVYFDGDFGIRIEDDVLVTDSGFEVLSDLPKGLDDCQFML